jgi:hypothetical protein
MDFPWTVIMIKFALLSSSEKKKKKGKMEKKRKRRREAFAFDSASGLCSN